MQWKVHGVAPRLRECARRSADADGLSLGAWIDRTVRTLPEPGRPSPPPETHEAGDIVAALEALEARLERGTARLERMTDFAASSAGTREPGKTHVLDAPSGPAAWSADRNEVRGGTAFGDGAPAAEEFPDAAEPPDGRIALDRAPDDDQGEAPERPAPDPTGHARRKRWRGPAVIAGTVLLVIGPLALLLRLGMEPPPGPAHAGADAARAASPSVPGTANGKAAGGDTAAPAFPVVDKPDVAIPRHLIAEAEGGDTAAQFALGEMLYTGRHDPTERKRGIAWIESAAAKGHAEAQFMLAGLITRGIGFKRNPKEAFFWYLSAAESGHTGAQFKLAGLYAAGRGTEKSLKKAARWYRAAAEKGNAEAAYQLGRMYELGLGLKTDRSEALEWYTRAKAQGSRPAAEKVRQMTALPASITPAPEPPVTRNPLPPGKRLGKAEIRELQSLLKALEFGPGAVNGRLDRQTREAIREYQRFAGLPETGEPSVSLLKELRAVADTPGTPSPPK